MSDETNSSGEPAPRKAPFGSIEALVLQIERMFDCKDGDHRAWHAEWDYAVRRYQDYPYMTLAAIAPASIENAAEQLRQTLYTALFKLHATCKSARPVLYWRYAKEMRIEEDSCGPGSVVYEGLPVTETKYKIRTRIAIPEADFKVVNELVFRNDGINSIMVLQE
jgi:hypothetical protein